MIVSAVGTSSSSRDRDLGREIEKAMTDAVIEAMDRGVAITDSESILRYKMEARAKVLASHGRGA